MTYQNLSNDGSSPRKNLSFRSFLAVLSTVLSYVSIWIAMSTFTPILSASFPHVYGGRPRGRFLNLCFGATLKFELIAGF